MYQVTEMLIRLNALEIQQALAIDLDRDSSEALQFIKEKSSTNIFRRLARNALSLGTSPIH